MNTTKIRWERKFDNYYGHSSRTGKLLFVLKAFWEVHDADGDCFV